MRVMLSLAMLALGGAAMARVQPEPKPSGIVIHLFQPKGGQPGAALSTPVILRRMFVTGDPDAKPGAAIPKGKAAQQP